MFKTRLLSGIVLVLLALLFIIHGGYLLLTVLGIISLIGLFELYRVFGIEKSAPGIVGYVAAIVYYLNLVFDFIPDSMMFVMALLIVCMCVFVFGYPKFHANQIIAAFFGVFYVAVMLSCIYETRSLEGGKYLVWLIFLCSWGCDTCAYCVGMLFGKHKMAPVLSPKKSIEGAVGGVLGAALLGAIYAAATGAYNPNPAHTPLIYAIICGVGALVSMVGDLAASAIKRQENIKDYGTLIPGHGGILDRFDSVIFTAPAIYFLAKLVLGI